MQFALCSIFVFFMLMTFVHSAPTAALDAATLLQNAQEAQQLNAQFQSANGTTSGSCNNGDTTCVKNAIATCVNGQFDTSNGRCAATQRCFALPSVKSNGTILACTSKKSAQSLINASGATGGITGSGKSGALTASMHPTSASSTLNGTIASATPAGTESVVTVTVTLTPSVPITLSSVTQTLSPDQASSLLSSLLAGGPAPTDTPTCSDKPPPSTFPASVTDIQTPIATASRPTATPSTSSASSSATTTAAVAVANIADGSTSSGSSYEAEGSDGY